VFLEPKTTNWNTKVLLVGKWYGTTAPENSILVVVFVGWAFLLGERGDYRGDRRIWKIYSARARVRADKEWGGSSADVCSVGMIVCWWGRPLHHRTNTWNIKMRGVGNLPRLKLFPLRP